MTPSRSTRPKRKRPKVVYKTPGRECPHADRGCCPRCLKPAQARPRLYSPSISFESAAS